MNIDPKLFAKATELANKILDLVQNQKADLALLAMLAAAATLRRKTTMTLDEVVERFRAADGIVEAGKFFLSMRKAAKQP